MHRDERSWRAEGWAVGLVVSAVVIGTPFAAIAAFDEVPRWLAPVVGALVLVIISAMHWSFRRRAVQRSTVGREFDRPKRQTSDAGQPRQRLRLMVLVATLFLGSVLAGTALGDDAQRAFTWAVILLVMVGSVVGWLYRSYVGRR